MSGLTPDQEREIVVKDNGENFGEWDFNLLANWSDEPLTDWGVDLPEGWLGGDKSEESVVPEKDPNILVRVSFHPGIWLGKRGEIITIMEKLKKTYGCDVKVEE